MKKLRENFADLMLELGKKNKNLCVMVGDISHGILQPFAKEFPERYYNIGICEPSMINLGAGMSKVGLIPVMHTIAPFIAERSYEQIKLDYGYQKLGGNFVTIGSAFDYSKLGCSHHCYTDISILSHFKNCNIFMPGSKNELYKLFKTVYKQNKINYFKLTDNSHGIYIDYKNIKFGKGIKIKNGKDLTIVAVGSQLKNAVNASKKLNNKDIDAEILYYPTIKPFDKNLFYKSLNKTKKFISVEELSCHDGIYNLCLRAINGKIKFHSKQMAIEDFIHSYGNYNDICNSSNLNEENIIKNAEILFKKTKL